LNIKRQQTFIDQQQKSKVKFMAMYNKAVLDNGLRVITSTMPHSHSVCLVILVCFLALVIEATLQRLLLAVKSSVSYQEAMEEIMERPFL